MKLNWILSLTVIFCIAGGCGPAQEQGLATTAKEGNITVYAHCPFLPFAGTRVEVCRKGGFLDCKPAQMVADGTTTTFSVIDLPGYNYDVKSPNVYGEAALSLGSGCTARVGDTVEIMGGFKGLVGDNRCYCIVNGLEPPAPGAYAPYPICWSDYVQKHPGQFPYCASCMTEANKTTSAACGGYQCDKCYFKRVSELGELCLVHNDCRDHEGLGKAGNACCSGRCATLQKDWAGVYYCPEDCVGTFGGAPGTCS